MKQSIKKILSIADKTYYNWKNEERPIIALLEKYFTAEDLNEFLEVGSIKRLESSGEESLEPMMIDYVLYNLQEKLDKEILIKKDLLDAIFGIGSKELFVSIFNEFYNIKVDINKSSSKDYLIEQIEKYPAPKAKKYKEQLVKIIKNKFSILECYVMLKYPDKFTVN